MCLILVAWRAQAEWPLVVAANRDELHARPSAGAAFWRDQPALLAGRDLLAQGTWLGIARNGRFASVTNYRGGHDPSAASSRGALVADFLAGNMDAARYAAAVQSRQQSYSGFNLLLADRDELWWLSNRGAGARRLEPGHYALGNLLLDTPEVQEVKQRFKSAPLAIEPLFGVLDAARITAPRYGTRCSTVVLAGSDGRIEFAERPFEADGAAQSTARFEFQAAA